MSAMPDLPKNLDRSDVIEKSWVITLSGRRFNILKPNPEDIILSDIASSLARQARFNGHTRFFFSVGQHSCLGAQAAAHDTKLAQWMLFHDATETYLGDLVSPVKKLLPDFEIIEARIQWAICKRFGLSFPPPKEVKAIDRRLLATEVRDLITRDLSSWAIQPEEPFEFQVVPWPVEVTESIFLELAKKSQVDTW